MRRIFTQVVRVQSYESIVITSLYLYERHVPKDIHTLIFNFIQLEEKVGRYSGKKPKQVANKVFSNIIRDHKCVNRPIIFKIKEITKGSRHKIFRYEGTRTKLDTPVRVKVGSGANTKFIEYVYNNTIKKVKTKHK